MRLLLLPVLPVVPATAGAQDLLALEQIFGPSAAAATLGHGGLTLAVGPDGTWVGANWPSPLGPDQLEFATIPAPDARTQPRLGAPPDAGLFLGLRVELAQGPGVFTWLRDAGWQTEQTWTGDGALVTTHRHDELGLLVSEALAVDPARDAASLRIDLQRLGGSGVAGTELFVYANFAPTSSAPEGAVTAADLRPRDDRHDLVAWWDADLQALVQGAPAGADASALGPLFDRPWPADAWAEQGLAEAIEWADAQPAGAWIGLAGPTPLAVHVGRDRACDAAADWAHDPIAAWDAVAAGTLDSPAAGCGADAAMAYALDEDTPVELTLTAQRSLDALRQALAFKPAHAAVVTAANAAPALDGLVLPAHPAARPSLLRILEATDAVTGARATSVVVQPPLAWDDGVASSLADTAMALVGLGSRDHRFFRATHQLGASARRDDASLSSPLRLRGSWPGRLNAEGAAIEEGPPPLLAVAWTTVAWWASAAALDDTPRSLALAGIRSSAGRAADLLSACVADSDPSLEPAPGPLAWDDLLLRIERSELPDPDLRDPALLDGDWASLAPCDLGGDPLQSALTLRAGLLAAVAIAELSCTEDAHSAWWQRRADELGAWALSTAWDGAAWSASPRGGLWPFPLGWGSTAELLVPDADARAALEADAAAARLAAAERVLDDADAALDGPGLQNGVQVTFEVLAHAAAAWLPEETVLRASLLLDELTARPDALGGVALRSGADLTSFGGAPHIGEHAAALLAALAVETPERFAALDAALPICATGEPPSWSQSGASCDGCSSSLSGSTTGLLALLLLAARRRREVV